MKNTGKSSEEDFEKLISKQYGSKAFIYKVVDTKSAGKVVKSAPADYITVIEGKTNWSEIKSCSNSTSFPFKNFTIAQKAGMTRVALAGGIYWVFIHNKNTNDWYKINACYITSAIKSGKKSMKWSEISTYCETKFKGI